MLARIIYMLHIDINGRLITGLFSRAAPGCGGVALGWVAPPTVCARLADKLEVGPNLFRAPGHLPSSTSLASIPTFAT
jgi:hypothetical protein